MSIIQLRHGDKFQNVANGIDRCAGAFTGGRFNIGMEEHSEDTRALLESRRRIQGKQGFILRVFCFELKWKFPLSAVLLESHFAITLFGFSWRLWSKKFMPVVPRSATGLVSDFTPEELKDLREDAVRQSECQGTPNPNAPFFKWVENGSPVYSNSARGTNLPKTTRPCSPKVVWRGEKSEEGKDYEAIFEERKKSGK